MCFQGVETDLQKKLHTLDKLTNKGQALRDTVDTGKETIDRKVHDVTDRWNTLDNGQKDCILSFDL